MKFLIFLLEWIGTLVVVFILNYVARWLLSKKFNPITVAVFAFIIVGFVVFLIAPFVITSVDPAWIYLPFLLIFLGIDVYRANKQM